MRFKAFKSRQAIIGERPFNQTGYWVYLNKCFIINQCLTSILNYSVIDLRHVFKIPPKQKITNKYESLKK